jgi:hypothetical protein
MNALIQEAREKNFEIQTAIPELAHAYQRLITRQIKIYDTIYLAVEQMERAQFERNSDIVIQCKVFAANVQTAFVVTRDQSTEAYKGHWIGLGKKILCSRQAWNSLSDLLDKKKES